MRWIGGMLLHARNVLLMIALIYFLVYQYVAVSCWAGSLKFVVNGSIL